MTTPNSTPIRVSPEDVQNEEFLVFSNGQEPPLFAAIQKIRDSRDPENPWLAVSGPLTEEELRIYFIPDDPLPSDVIARKKELEGNRPFEIGDFEWLKIAGEYPGGLERAATNIARLILGME